MTSRPHLTPVPKPDGHEFVDRRSAEDSSAWLPANALYDASVEIAANGVSHALIVAWYEANAEGKIRMRWRAFGKTHNDLIALSAQLAVAMAHE